MTTRHLLRASTILMVAAAAGHAAARCDDKKEPPGKVADYASGLVADASLAKKAPAGGTIVTKKAWEGLLEAWEVPSPFPVDFDKHFVVVATSQGSTLKLTTALDDNQGNLAVKVVASLDLRPGFRYALKRVDRAGVKTVNGKVLGRD